jgi:hypothetical protein
MGNGVLTDPPRFPFECSPLPAAEGGTERQ